MLNGTGGSFLTFAETLAWIDHHSLGGGFSGPVWRRAASLAAPAIVTAAKTDTAPIVGTGDYQYEVLHGFPQLPDKYHWMTTHNVAFDREGNLYVIHEGKYDQPKHPTIFVFDADGKFIRAFGEQFSGGGHGLEIRNEGGQDFLYVCAYQQQRSFAKLDTMGSRFGGRVPPWRAGSTPTVRTSFLERKTTIRGVGIDSYRPTSRFCPTAGSF